MAALAPPAVQGRRRPIRSGHSLRTDIRDVLSSPEKPRFLPAERNAGFSIPDALRRHGRPSHQWPARREQGDGRRPPLARRRPGGRDASLRAHLRVRQCRRPAAREAAVPADGRRPGEGMRDGAFPDRDPAGAPFRFVNGFGRGGGAAGAGCRDGTERRRRRHGLRPLTARSAFPRCPCGTMLPYRRSGKRPEINGFSGAAGMGMIERRMKTAPGKNAGPGSRQRTGTPQVPVSRRGRGLRRTGCAATWKRAAAGMSPSARPSPSASRTPSRQGARCC